MLFEITIDGWSAFPSDHAALFFALTVGILFISRGAGVLAISYVAVFICLPRIYVGLHYPSDIIAGALLGGSVCFVVRTYLRRSKIVPSALQFEQHHPGPFYVVFFLLTYQTANLFEAVCSLEGV